jgi:hypothetical protein
VSMATRNCFALPVSYSHGSASQAAVLLNSIA